MRKKTKIVLFTGYSCNNNCRFCINSGKRDLPGKSTRELVRDIYAAGEKGAEILEIIGGEATIRPDFSVLVRAAKRVGIPAVVCATNGRVFADPAAAREIVGSGIDSLVFSIHGHSAVVHDRLTRVRGSFEQLLQGIANLKELGFDNICGNTTVVKSNMRGLPKLAGLYADLGVRCVEYIFVDPNCGGANTGFKALVPRIADAAPYMREALRAGAKRGYPGWTVRYVPLCHFQGYEAQVSETMERAVFLTEHWAPDFKNTDVSGSRAVVGRRKTEACRGCRKAGECEGIWVEYLRRYGDGELTPVK